MLPNIKIRTVTGFFIVSVTIASVVVGPVTFIIFCATINLLALIEFYRLLHLNFGSGRIIGLILSVTMVFSSFLLTWNLVDWQIVLINVPLVAAIFITFLYRQSENPFQHLALIFLGLIYITMPLIFFNSIAFLPFWEGTYQMKIILGYFFILWSSDTGAYLVGSSVGKHLLFERISPKKTWEGSIAGAVSALIIAGLLSFFFTNLTVASWMTIAIIIILFGTLGDLVKSMLKRSVNVKDSGAWLPGHGGFIDRFDSLLGSAPFVFAYLAIFLKL
ncbi:MAG TPA: phosphatidate cytidylyltransferase [Cyclobacteriaceae bacterium]|nr:phosphatidate cytidylyltransferase [Cyclobacteriaceae bacterium]